MSQYLKVSLPLLGIISCLINLPAQAFNSANPPAPSASQPTPLLHPDLQHQDPGMENIFSIPFIVDNNRNLYSPDRFPLLDPSDLSDLSDLPPYDSSETVAVISIFDLFGFLKIPSGVPGRSSFQGIFRGAISHFFVRNLSSVIKADRPIFLDRSAVYPTEDYLPGTPKRLGLEGLELSIQDDLADGSVSITPSNIGTTVSLPDSEVASNSALVNTSVSDEQAPEIAFAPSITSQDWYVADYGAAETDPSRTARLIDELRFLAKFPTKTRGSIMIAPGDYSLPVNISCLATTPNPKQASNRYFLAPLQGTRADALITLNSIAISLDDALMTRGALGEAGGSALDFGIAETLDFRDLQNAFMMVQSGFSLEEMDDETQEILKLLPSELRKPLRADFLQRARANYEQFQARASSVNFPDFDEVLDNLGPFGPVLQSYREMREDIVTGESDYQSVMTSWLEDKDAEEAEKTFGTGETPWSQLEERIFARIGTTQACISDTEERLATGTFQMRIMPPTLTDARDKIAVPIMAIFGDPRDASILPIIGVPRLPKEENVMQVKTIIQAEEIAR